MEPKVWDRKRNDEQACVYLAACEKAGACNKYTVFQRRVMRQIEWEKCEARGDKRSERNTWDVPGRPSEAVFVGSLRKGGSKSKNARDACTGYRETEIKKKREKEAITYKTHRVPHSRPTHTTHASRPEPTQRTHLHPRADSLPLPWHLPLQQPQPQGKLFHRLASSKPILTAEQPANHVQD